jgi:DNA-directed RNA polymerase specialized sigma24 family protein
MKKILSRRLAAVQVRKAISKLPVKQSGAIVMRYFEQQDYENIAVTIRIARS